MATAPQGKTKITPKLIEQQLHLSPAQAQQLQRIVLAGKKIMFSRESHGMVKELLQGEGDISQKLGTGVAGLMGLLMQESRNSLPAMLIIPAGLVLVAEGADFLRQAGESVPDSEVTAAMGEMTSAVLGAAGVDPEKVAQAGDRGLKQGTKQ